MEQSRQKLSLYKLCVIVIILNSLGFPGNYIHIAGGTTLDSLVGYACFALEIMLIVVTSGSRFTDLRVVNLKYKYRFIYMLLVIFFVDSMLTTAAPKEQLISCLRFSMTVLFAMWLVDSYSIAELLELIHYAEAVYLVLAFAFVVLKPGLAYNASEGGFTFLRTAKNSEASNFVLSISLQYILMQYKRARKEKISRYFIAILVLKIIALLMCNSKGGALCMILILMYPLTLHKWIGRRNIGLIYIVISAAFPFIMLTVASVLEPVFNMLGKDATLTGRTDLWREIVYVMSRNKTFTGYGYGMFWRDASGVALLHSRFDRYSFFGTMTTGAHNVVFELWLNVGLIGIATYFITLAQTMSHFRKLDEEQYMMCTSYLIAFMVHGLTERAFATYDYQTLFLFMVMAVGCSGAPERVIRNARKNQRDYSHLQRRGLSDDVPGLGTEPDVSQS